MKLSVIICHYKNGKATAYAIHQILKHKKNHDLQILICDNSNGEGVEYLEPFKGDIEIHRLPSYLLQSHGVGYSYLGSFVTNDFVLCMESDSYPISDDFIDYYDPLIEDGYDMAAPLLKLSGGQYFHPCGGIYKRKAIEEAEAYCSNSNMSYHYLPNSAMVNGFPNHLMVHDKIWRFFLDEPHAFVELPDNRKFLTAKEWEKIELGYSSVVCAFHNGMGKYKETINDYGARGIITDPAGIILDHQDKIIVRMGYEPGQWLSYWMLATSKKIAQIPVTVKWMEGKENQQQEYTITDGGILHEWGLSSYYGAHNKDIQDIVDFKNRRTEMNYLSLPEEYKIKNPIH